MITRSRGIAPTARGARGVILARSRAAPRPAARPAARPENPEFNELRLNRMNFKKPSAFNTLKLEPVKVGNTPQNIPEKLRNALRNRQVMKILGFKEEPEHKLLKQAIYRQIQRQHKPVPKPKKGKSPEGPMRERQMRERPVLEPYKNLLIKKLPPNLFIPFNFSSSNTNTNSELRKMLRKSLVTAKAKAKYLGSRSVKDLDSAKGVSTRYSKFHKTHPRIRQQKRPIASA